MINDLIALNKKALEHHENQVIAMNNEMQKLRALKDETQTHMDRVDSQRSVMIHESKLLKQTLDILENK